MRFYNEQHKYYCGIDLHAKKMYLCIMNQQGDTVFLKNIPSKPDHFLKAIAPFREDLVVRAHCTAQGNARH